MMVITGRVSQGVRFKDIPVGSVFVYATRAYIRASDDYVVNLETGILSPAMGFGDNKVIPAPNAKVVLE